MDRQMRKANFKKLQQPATTRLRSTRSGKTGAATVTLSDFFDAPEADGEDPQQEQPVREHVENEDPFAEPKIKKIRENHESGNAPAAKPKKAPKLKSTSSQRRGRGGTRGRSKQQPSISDFLRNEQLFAEVTAQHCMADNFSPDDIEMALALSKSEAEKHGRLRLNDAENEENVVVNLLDDTSSDQSTDIIRLKLQKYGFRTAAKQDYNVLAFGAMPGVKGKRCKWANKFTALTLRNPAEQVKKVEAKVAALMAQQVRTRLPGTKDQLSPAFKLISPQLQLLEATDERRITHEPSEGKLTNPEAYYVRELVEVSEAPADHLLKSWAAIQGRDLSPKRLSTRSLQRKQQLEKVYAELEAHFEASAEQEELDELEKLVADNMIEDNSQFLDNVNENMSPSGPANISIKKHCQILDTDAILESSQRPADRTRVSLNNSPLKEPPDKRARMQTQDETKLPIIADKILEANSSAELCVPTQSIRCTSPDLFADSDDDEPDTETPPRDSLAVEMQNFSLKVYKDIATNDLSCYEVFSSDEVKTINDAEVKDEVSKEDSEAAIVDLTQDSPGLEFELNNSTGRSILDQPIFQLSPEIDFDVQSEPMNQAENCELSDRLWNTSMNRANCNPNSTNQSKQSDSFPDLSLTSSAKSIASTSLHLATSFNLSQLDSTNREFHRSFSLPQSPGSSLKVDHSFKSPLNRRSNSFTEKPASRFTSPFSQSDASVDLTQNSSDNEQDENGGVLLSDDEINYSIWKADKTVRNIPDAHDGSSSSSKSISSSPLARIKSVPYFKTEEDLDAYLDASPAVSNKSGNSRSPNKSALSKERAEFGILDAAPSQPFTLSQLQSPRPKVEASQVNIDWNNASFLETPPAAPLKRYSINCTHKFKDLLSDIPTKSDIDDEFDEFDRLVFQNTREATPPMDTLPSGLDRLLMGEINEDHLPTSIPPASVSPLKASATSEQLEVNGEVYEVSACHKPKPDFVNMTEAELLQQLYNYGIKPLKRKQAVKLLEFIYNQTHPIMLPQQAFQPEPLPRSKSTPLTSCISKSKVQLLHTVSEDCLTPTTLEPNVAKRLNDACGSELLRFSQIAPPDLCDDFEFYVLQTNVTKKTPQPLLPLHIAWHNLLCANPSLHESVLMYEPIDLQEIYLYLKQLGHRYDPKDLKCFFDRRCIIFRYELAPPAKQAQRHIRKTKTRSKKPVAKF